MGMRTWEERDRAATASRPSSERPSSEEDALSPSSGATKLSRPAGAFALLYRPRSSVVSSPPASEP